MMVDNLFLKFLWVVIYSFTAYYTFTGQMMLAMYWMAGGMFLQSVIDLVVSLISSGSKKSMENRM
ncbi:hypothetical protein FC52_GL000436 [Lactobacillus pasteurii DSM 23907 = CRBIP 24.76]|uniref:Uncharacterized protein n=1 Tax=Lactobacillus pasteurii DSM 23907 = CRBIP 24.76 TaxID=1423790 RepID=I7JYU7_9LACO|nr:hypothetical protein [Lactobacillus pasteurii]KRK08735.1 hypothetical protein FC52_GL000436 [Lactobacillus pasteurii DSM 23907 = CRBIP 24.76]TDG76431.1 hypothetical protein C5L33_001190 [Lactobacillus pasteurii]CCI85845.1 Putative uncharacterized protein [Lactobacillus pasteurii DSM 23907 = CRBIP 24.76]